MLDSCVVAPGIMTNIHTIGSVYAVQAEYDGSALDIVIRGRVLEFDRLFNCTAHPSTSFVVTSVLRTLLDHGRTRQLQSSAWWTLCAVK